MYRSGNVTIFVTDMDRAVRFYEQSLGLKLAYRFGDHWASLELGKGLTIGLHPAASVLSPEQRKGSPAIGLELEGKLEDAIQTLEGRGVHFEGIAEEGKAGRFAHFHDPDGNLLYLAQLNWAHVNQGEGTYPNA